MSVRESDDPRMFARIQEQNLLRQYDLLTNCIEIGLAKGIESFDKYTLWSLNAAAVANIAQFGGRFREQPIYVGNHIPPHFQRVPTLMDSVIERFDEETTSLPELSELEARAIAEQHLAGLGGVELARGSKEYDVGWTFRYQSVRHLGTRSWRDAFGGNAPILIDRHTATVWATGTAHPEEFYVANYRATGNPAVSAAS